MPYADIEQARERDRGRVRERRARGLCASCPNAAAPHRSRCETCRLRYNARRRKLDSALTHGLDCEDLADLGIVSTPQPNEFPKCGLYE